MGMLDTNSASKMMIINETKTCSLSDPPSGSVPSSPHQVRYSKPYQVTLPTEGAFFSGSFTAVLLLWLTDWRLGPRGRFDTWPIGWQRLGRVEYKASNLNLHIARVVEDAELQFIRACDITNAFLHLGQRGCSAGPGAGPVSPV